MGYPKFKIFWPGEDLRPIWELLYIVYVKEVGFDQPLGTGFVINSMDKTLSDPNDNQSVWFCILETPQYVSACIRLRIIGKEDVPLKLQTGMTNFLEAARLAVATGFRKNNYAQSITLQLHKFVATIFNENTIIIAAASPAIEKFYLSIGYSPYGDAFFYDESKKMQSQFIYYYNRLDTRKFMLYYLERKLRARL